MNKFYIYRWIRLDTNTPFYVGKGFGDRFKEKSNGRNRYFKSIIKSVPCVSEIILCNLSEEYSFKKEIEFITLYKSFGMCEANLTTGGLGKSGYKFSELSKNKISKTLKERFKIHKNPMSGRSHSNTSIKKMSNAQSGENHHLFGKKRSDDFKKKLSDKLSGKLNPQYGIPSSRRRKVLCLNSDVIYESVQMAADSLGLFQSNITKVCQGRNKHTKGYRFKYV